jgi:hypothetical protein
MTCPLNADCFTEILEYLENDKNTLHSCLLVNHLLCKVSVEILWRNIWNFKLNSNAQLQIINILFACLPNKSKKLLCEDGTIFIPTSKPPLFDYASFFKALSIGDITIMVKLFQESKKLGKTGSSGNPNHLNRLKKNRDLLTEEILKMFTKKISLKLFNYSLDDYNKKISNDIILTDFPGAKDCLKNLTELKCIDHPDFLFQLSQICYNIQSLEISYQNHFISNNNELGKLISSQDNLKCLKLKQFYDYELIRISNSLKKKSNKITKLHLESSEILYNLLSLSFIVDFTNLQELSLLINCCNKVEYEKLNYVIFPKLRYFAIEGDILDEILYKFLENNGENLEEFKNLSHYSYYYESINLAIAKFCLNLKSLHLFHKSKTLTSILNSCQQLERIIVYCDYQSLDLLEIIARNAPKNLHGLELRESYLRPDELECFFKIWKDRMPNKSLSFIIKINEKNEKVINKYKKLGVIK